MGKKRKCQDKSESIDAKKKSKQIKNVISKDVIENVNENSDTDIQLGFNKKIKGKKIKETVAENVNENSDSDKHISCKEKIKNKKNKEKIAEDVIENVNENSDTDVHLSFDKKVNGKKNKEKTVEDVVETVNEARKTGLQSDNQRKRKNKKIKDKIAADVFENQECEVSVQVNSNEKRKGKNIKDGLSIDNIKNVSEESVVPSTNNFRAINNSGTPKKIIFVDDEPQEVSATANKTKENKSFKKRKEFYNDTLKEEDVKDEDIDKFCDELDEEDNKQYEDWVQLIEASLSSNKKKPK